MAQNVDVLVAGGSTAGLYFAGLMARQGYNTLVCDPSPREELGKRYDIIHIAKEHFSRFGIPEPESGDEDYVETFHWSILRSALDKWPKNSHVDILVLRRLPLMRRLARWAEGEGAKILCGMAFTNPLFDEAGRLNGGILQGKGEELRVTARLTADASGIGAAVRTRLPPGYGVENFVTGPRDQFYVTLQYVKLKKPEKDAVEVTVTWPYYKTWMAPQQDPHGAILGVGACLSFDYATACFKRFAGIVSLPEYELDHIEQSSTPYRCPPYSFVADGFVALGDAACITNPWSGEGVPYAWLLCSIAAEECGRAMRNGAYPGREAVWPVNLRYIKAQGAQFAQNLILISGGMNCTARENDYEFENAIVFEDETEKGKGSLAFKLLKALVSGGLSLRALLNLLGAASGGGKMYKHYMAFPETPGGFDKWVQKADRLWAKTGSMASLAENDMRGMGEK